MWAPDKETMTQIRNHEDKAKGMRSVLGTVIVPLLMSSSFQELSAEFKTLDRFLA